MPISKDQFSRALAAAALTVSVSVGSGTVLMSSQAFAFDPNKTFKPDDEPQTILRYGFNALKQGNMADAVGAFRFGAKKNNLASQWKLARMLQRGLGVEQDDIGAYNLYVRIANRFRDTTPHSSDIPFVSNALVSLGRYALVGVKGSQIQANPQIAEHHFYRAAALYKDPEAQFELGRLYRSQALGVSQPRTAVRWFGLAARKGHAYAQSELGEMLFYGEGVRRRPVRGLVYLTRAATGKSLGSLRERHDQAFAEASKEQREAVARIMGDFTTQGAQPESGFQLRSATSE